MPDDPCAQLPPGGVCPPPDAVSDLYPGGGLGAAAATFIHALEGILTWALDLWTGGTGADWGAMRQAAAATAPAVRWLAAAAMATSLVVGAVRVMYHRRGETAADIGVGLLSFVVLSVVSWAAVGAAWTVSEALSQWVLDPAHADPAGYAGAVLGGLQQVDPALAVMLSVLGIAACVALSVALLARAAAAVGLALILPVVAAGGARSAGLRALGWALALLAYRPLIAVLYRMLHAVVVVPGQATQPVQTVVVGVSGPLLAAACLPLLLRHLGEARRTAAGVPATGAPRTPPYQPVPSPWPTKTIARALPTPGAGAPSTGSPPTVRIPDGRP